MADELQEIYEEARRRGKLNDPALHDLFAEAVKRGRIRDVSGGSVNAPQSPAQAQNIPDPTIGRPSNLPPLTAPSKLPTDLWSAYKREYINNPELASDPANYMYDLAGDSGRYGLAAQVPDTDDPGIRGILQRGAKSGLGLADAFPSIANNLLGANVDIQSGNTAQGQRGVEKLQETGLGMVPFSHAVTGYLEGMGTSAAALDLPKGSPFRQALEEQGDYQRNSALGSVADMMEQNPIEAAINVYPLAHGLAHPLYKAGAGIKAAGDVAGVAGDAMLAAPEAPVKGTSPARTPTKIVGADYSKVKELKPGEKAPETAVKKTAVKRSTRSSADTENAVVDTEPSTAPKNYAQVRSDAFNAGGKKNISSGNKPKPAPKESVSIALQDARDAAMEAAKNKRRKPSPTGRRAFVPRKPAEATTTPASPETPFHSEVPIKIDGENKTLVMDAVIDAPKPADAPVPGRDISANNTPVDTSAASVKRPRNPREPKTTTTAPAPAVDVESAPKTESVVTPDTVIPGTVMTHAEVNEKALLTDKAYNNKHKNGPALTAQEVLRGNELSKKSGQSDPLTKAEADYLNSVSTYAFYEEGEISALSRQRLSSLPDAPKYESKKTTTTTAPAPAIETVPKAEAVTPPVETPDAVTTTATSPVPVTDAPKAPVKKVSSDVTIPGTDITYGEFEKYKAHTKAVEGKTTSQMTPEEAAANDRYIEQEKTARPLEQEEADILNASLKARGKKPKYDAGDVSLMARKLLDNNDHSRVTAAQSINAAIKATKGKADYATYERIQHFFNDESNRWADGEWRVDEKFIKPMEAYADKHFKTLHEQYAPGTSDILGSTDVVERMVKSDIAASAEPSGSGGGRKSSPETIEKYYKLRDETEHGDYNSTSAGRKFLSNNKHLEDAYNESRKDGVPKGKREYSEQEDLTSRLRTKKTVPAPSDAASEFDMDFEPKLPKNLTTETTKYAEKNAKEMKDTSNLTPAEKVYLSDLPDTKKAEIEAARVRKGYGPLYEWSEDGTGVVRADAPAKAPSKARVAVDKFNADTAASIAETRKTINKQLKGVDPKQSGHFVPIALADIARDVAGKLADKSLKGYESAAAYIEQTYGAAAKKYHRTIVEQARKFNTSGLEDVLPQGTVRNRKGEEVDTQGNTISLADLSAANVINPPDVVRPGDNAPLPVSREKLDKVMQSRKVKIKQNSTARSIKARVDSSLDSAILPPIKKFLRAVNASNKVYNEQVKTGIHESRVEDTLAMQKIRDDKSLTRQQKIDAMWKVRYGSKTPDVTVKKLAENMTVQDMNTILKKIDAAGLPSQTYLNANQYFQHLMEGVPLRNGEAALLHRILGKEFVDVMRDNRTVAQKNWDRIETLKSIWLSQMFSFDRGSFARNGKYQTARLLVTDPKKLAASMGKMFSASTDIPGVTSKVGGGYKARHDAIQKELTESPLFKEAQDMGIKFGGIEKHDAKWMIDEDGNPLKPGETDEQFAAKRIVDELASQSRDKLTLLDRNNGPAVQITLSPRMKKALSYYASALQAAEYGHNTLLNSYRMDMYEKRSGYLKELGFTPEQHPEVFKQMTTSIMTETGRGEFGPVYIPGRGEFNLEGHEGKGARQVMDTVMLAPRFRKAAFDMTLGSGRKAFQELVRLNPAWAAPYEKSFKVMEQAEAMPNGTPAETLARDNAINAAYSMRYSSLPRKMRLESLKSMAASTAIGASVMAAATLAGAKVEKDWWKPDFGYIKWPDGSVTDVFQQDRKPVQLYLMMLNKAVQAGNAEVIKNQKMRGAPTSREIKYPSVLDPIGAYFVTGLAPGVPQATANLARGRGIGGDTGITGTLGLQLPLMIEDMKDLGLNGYKKGGMPGAAKGVGLGSMNYVGANSRVFTGPKKTAGGGSSSPSLPSLSGSLPSLP